MNNPWSKAGSLTLLADLSVASTPELPSSVMITGPMQLYNLNADPGELHDVAADHPDLVVKAAADMKEAHVPSLNFVAPGEH